MTISAETVTAETIVAIVSAARFCFTGETDLQIGLAASLNHAGLDVAREVRLTPRERVDLVVGRVGIEVKVAGGWREAERQLHRYLDSPLLDAVLLVTAKSVHLKIAQGQVGPPLTPTTRKLLLVHQITTSGL